ncbi:hypothetical protein D7V86_09965 [bacterium D16-51]|nr:hypothetical protein D7V96_15180 [bacterium D16-59]RKI60167.1 hypothetical protein D7V86_09965 [bacterium D16-51]
MFRYIIYCMGIFFIVLEIIVLLYLLQSVVDMGRYVRLITLILVEPILSPMQKLIKHSVMNTFSLDLSPYILLIILYYLGKVCDYLYRLPAV